MKKKDISNYVKLLQSIVSIKKTEQEENCLGRLYGSV